MNKMEIIIQIIGAVGSLATFGAFLMLFKKDKNKQEQLDRLTVISSVLENQAESLRKQNDLISQQVDIYRNTSILNKQNDEALSRLKEIEEEKLLLSVKPNLWLNGARYKGYEGELSIDLNNKGETAILKKFELISDDLILHSEHLPYDLEKGERKYIFARTKGEKHIKDCAYSDKINNEYKTEISGKGTNVKLIETLKI
jgi:hypothetical protein